MVVRFEMIKLERGQTRLPHVSTSHTLGVGELVGAEVGEPVGADFDLLLYPLQEIT